MIMEWEKLVEKEVPSFELCEELKRLHFPQGMSGIYWINDSWVEERRELILLDEVTFGKYITRRVPLTKAPTSSEIDKWLPAFIRKDPKKKIKDGYGYDLIIRKERDNTWSVEYIFLGYGDYWENVFLHFEGKTEIEAKTKALIWLIKNKYVKF